MLSQQQKFKLVSECPELLKDARRGIERECLRIDTEGKLSLTPHAKALGSALTHPSITTDYSESLLEFITKAHTSIDKTLAELDDIHSYTAQILNQNGEALWPASMPCIVGRDNDIPVAQYGSSNSAKLKTSYRFGLGHRYGRMMQTISGIHYNYSISDNYWHALHQTSNSELSFEAFKTNEYFSVIRNFRRNFWLLLYFFGASPAVCANFVERNDQHELEPLTHCTFGGKNATSLRMGDLGYQSNAQSELIVCYNELPQYLRTLVSAINTEHQSYVDIGTKVGDQYKQLSTSLLQIENEFYSTIRPKRTAERGETALHALKHRGVEYIEVRCLDINPYEPRGISSEQCHFVEAFLIWCSISDSPETFNDEYHTIAENQRRVVSSGRDQNIELHHPDGYKKLRVWALESLAEIQDVAKILDQANNTSNYSKSVDAQKCKIEHDSLTLSGQLLNDCLANRQGFSAIAKKLADQHADYWQNHLLTEEKFKSYELLAKDSITQQHEIESNDLCDFETYLANYLNQYKDPTLVE